MSAAFSWFLAYRYLVTRRASMLGMAGIAIAIWALIVVVAVFSGFIAGIRDNIKSGTPELVVTDLAQGASYAALDGILKTDAAVAATAPRLRHYALYYAVAAPRVPIARIDAMPQSPLGFDYVELVGIDTHSEQELGQVRTWLDDTKPDMRVEDDEKPLSISAKRVRLARGFLGLDDSLPMIGNAPGIVFGEPRAERLLPGQEVALVTTRRTRNAEGATALPQLRRFAVVTGAFRSRHRVVDWTQALVDLEVLRTMLGHDALDPRSIDLVSEVAIRAQPGTDLTATAARLTASLRTAGHRATVHTWEQHNAVFLGAVDQERGMTKLVLLAVVLVAVFLVYSTLHMMVAQKVKDIGILASMGASRGTIQALFLLCGAAIATIGCALGTTIGVLTSVYLDAIDRSFIGGPVSSVASYVLGWFGASPVQLSLFPRTLYALDEIPTVVEPAWVAQVATGAFLIALLAAWVPARRAARLEPVRALSYE